MTCSTSAFAAAILLLWAASSCAPLPRRPLTEEHQGAVREALRKQMYRQPALLEISGAGFVVADFEMPNGTLMSPRRYGEARLLAIREALLPFGYRSYRVNVNGPPPGTGLVSRYGSARLIDGGSLEWLTP